MQSLRGRLIAIIILLIAASVASGFVMYRLFQQSASAQIGQAESVAARACDAIAATYRSAGSRAAPPDLDDDRQRRDLTAIVAAALRDRKGIEGGLWTADRGAVAYAFPTYEGGSAKTDVPEAELPRIRAINQAALGGHARLARFDSPSQTLLIAACPLPGPITGLTAWTMTRVHPFGGEAYQQLMIGLAILFAAVAGASILAALLILTWSRHIGRIEAALNRSDIEDLPPLRETGERELDRIVIALNDAGQRLTASRERTDTLTKQVAIAERLAMIGRVAAGVAHEIRNPIATMRLKAELALDRAPQHKDEALKAVVGQIDRLDLLVARLLSASEREPSRPVQVEIAPFLDTCAAFHGERAAQKNIKIATVAEVDKAWFDADQMRSALDNLILNAIQAAPGGTIKLIATRIDDALVFRVADEGSGPPEKIRDHLFEPFVTGRADGTGLGLAIVRETAAGHGGTARFFRAEDLTFFEIEIPWRTY